jgi:hypothetical protein
MPYKNPEDAKLWGRRYRRTEKGKEVCRKSVSDYQRSDKGKATRWKYREGNRDKINARCIARRKVQEEECGVEGCFEIAERHHDDYNIPTEVEHLCKAHHLEVHNAA